MDETALGRAQRPDDLQQAWQRLLSLEQEVRELRRLLLTNVAHQDAHDTQAEGPSTATVTLRAGVSEPSADWQITCLGAFQLTQAGRTPPTCSSRRGWGILQYLLLRPGRAATRDALIEAFWPDGEPCAGAHSLQMAIHALRRTLRGYGPGGNDEAILFRDGQYGVNPGLTVDSDVQRFRSACDRGRKSAASGQFEAARRSFEEAWRSTLARSCPRAATTNGPSPIAWASRICA